MPPAASTPWLAFPRRQRIEAGFFKKRRGRWSITWLSVRCPMGGYVVLDTVATSFVDTNLSMARPTATESPPWAVTTTLDGVPLVNVSQEACDTLRLHPLRVELRRAAVVRDERDTLLGLGRIESDDIVATDS